MAELTFNSRVCALNRYPTLPPCRNLPEFHRQEVAESEFKPSKVLQPPKDILFIDEASFSLPALPVSRPTVNMLGDMGCFPEPQFPWLIMARTLLTSGSWRGICGRGHFLPWITLGSRFRYICVLPAFQEFSAVGQVDTGASPFHELYG